MTKSFPLVATVLTVILMALLACAGATPAPEPKETRVPASIATATLQPANTPRPEATATRSPAPTVGPTTVPTAAPTSTPTPTPDGRLAPIRLHDSQALVSSLSQAELACIGDVPETLDLVRAWPSQESKDELLRLIGCLGNETLARLFLSGLVAGPEPLSLETSDCVRAAFAVIDPKEAMTAGIENDPVKAGRAIAASTAAATTVTACLADEEWERATPMMEMGPQDRASQRCLLETLGGPAKMAEAMKAAGEGNFAALAGAGKECGLDMGPPPGQAPAEPSPAPTSVPLPTQAKQAPSQPQDIPALTVDQVTRMKKSISDEEKHLRRPSIDRDAARGLHH